MTDPLALLYGAAVAVRNRCYDRGLFPVERVGVPVVSVGNITAGGTGKTPFVEFLARTFLARGVRTVILSRGYGRATSGTVIVSAGDGTPPVDARAGGDEPVQMARHLPGAAVVVDERRVRGARAAAGRFHPGVIILDDGFQHRALARDLDIVMIDGSAWPVALLPTGRGREPLASVARADLVAVTRRPPGADLRRAIAEATEAPVITVAIAPSALVDASTGRALPTARAAGKRTLGFCGIGAPASFRAALEGIGCVILDVMTFGDHHDYSGRDMRRIAATAAAAGAEIVVTTEKDLTRLGPGAIPLLHALAVEASVPEGGELLSRLLARVAA